MHTASSEATLGKSVWKTTVRFLYPKERHKYHKRTVRTFQILLVETEETFQLNPTAILFTLSPTKPASSFQSSAHLISPAVLCGGDFSACFPLCFMSDSRCRMLMVISELRRQMKIQLKEGKVKLGFLSSVYWNYQFPLQRQTRLLSCGREKHRVVASWKLNPTTCLMTKR